MSLDQSLFEDMRETYRKRELNENEAGNSPFELFETWFSEALVSGVPEPNAMTLATVSVTGIPSARIVLLKGFSREGFKFYSNYQSRKGKEIEVCHTVALLFFWPQLERQIRIGGSTEKLNPEESSEYFKKRPRESQIGAIVSNQSEITTKADLETSYTTYLNSHQNTELIKPEHWGGYRVRPLEIEFWQGRPSRLHDRLLFTRETITSTIWQQVRLAP